MVPSRKRRGLAEIQLRIAEFKSSGLTKTEFATRLGVHPHLYALVTERRLDTAGVWHPAPQIPSRILEQLSVPDSFRNRPDSASSVLSSLPECRLGNRPFVMSIEDEAPHRKTVLNARASPNLFCPIHFPNQTKTEP